MTPLVTKQRLDYQLIAVNCFSPPLSPSSGQHVKGAQCGTTCKFRSAPLITTCARFRLSLHQQACGQNLSCAYASFLPLLLQIPLEKVARGL